MNEMIIFFLFTKKKKNNKIGFATMLKSELMLALKKEKGRTETERFTSLSIF
jgi:hypothetical protein